MKHFFTILALFGTSAFGGLHEEVRYLESLPCTDAKAYVEEAPEVTYFRIIADSGETLLVINSKNTTVTPFDLLLTHEFLNPEYGHWAFANNTRYHITVNQTTAGVISRFAGKIGVDLFKEFENVHYKSFSVIKSETRCVRIHGFSVVIHPTFDINKYDGFNMTALLWSSLFGLTDLARDLVESGADVNQGVGSYGTPVIAAVFANMPGLVEFLVQRGADIHRNKKREFSTLHIAAFAGSTEVARILMDHGVNVNENNNFGRATPLHFAATFGKCDTIEQLMSKGANHSLLDRMNRTPFQAAIAYGHLDCARILFAAGDDVNARDSEGDTALTLTVIYHKSETKLVKTVDRFLREFNPDINIKNKNGDTALSLATRKNFTKVAELLKSKGAI